MSERDDPAYLRDILEAITVIREYTAGMGWEQFFHDRKTQDAVIRRLEIIGEAGKRVSRAFQAQYPDVPWSEAAKMRDKLIHGYLGVDLDVVWSTVQDDLPSLYEKLTGILEHDGPRS